MYLPAGVAVDGLDDIFIADSHHNRVREVSAINGKIQTVAGDGNSGYDGTATIATSTSLNVPGGVAIDGVGNLLIADTNNNLIRRVNLATGSIVTVAGTGQPGYTGDSGLATSATLNSPQGITVDAAGTCSSPTPATTSSARWTPSRTPSAPSSDSIPEAPAPRAMVVPPLMLCSMPPTAWPSTAPATCISLTPATTAFAESVPAVRSVTTRATARQPISATAGLPPMPSSIRH